MKKTFSILLALALALSLGLVMVAQTPTPVLAASMYEYYNTGENSFVYMTGSRWAGQTFTPSVAHTITSVKLMLYRTLSPGTVTVSIRATSGGLPTGSDLCSGTTNGNTLTTASAGEWREITLGSGYGLSAGTQYAIVVRATGPGSVQWLADGTSPTYGGGTAVLSLTDAGLTWTLPGAYDFMFEEWGDPLGAGGDVGWETYPVSKVRVLLPWIALVAAIIAGATLLVVRRRRAQS